MKGESYIQLCGSKVKVKGELAFINQEFSMVKGVLIYYLSLGFQPL